MTSSVYNYMQNAKVWLPMTAACHDATNLRTLDRSGNNNHATFGDGATATTFPTKISGRRGYSFDGGDYLNLGDLPFLSNATQFTFALALSNRRNNLSNYYLAKRVSDTALIRLWNFPTAPGYLFLYLTNGSAITNAYIAPNTPVTEGGLVILTITYNGALASNRVKFNVDSTNYLPTGDTTPVTTANLAGSNLLIGGNVAPYYVGNYHFFAAWDYVLSQVQVADLSNRLFRSYNDV